MKSNIKSTETKLRLSKKEHDLKLEKSISNYSGWLIKGIGIVGAIMGLIILGVFFYWVLKMLLKVG